MMSPSKMQWAALPGGHDRKLEGIELEEFTSTARQTQHLQRLYLISFDAARIVAELAFGVAR